MKKMRIWGILSVFGILLAVQPVFSQDKATPEEVYEKVNEAAKVLEVLGDEALSEFNKPDGDFVWKDTYVWVLHCPKWTNAAHPFIPSLVGQDLENIQDKDNNYFFQDFCKAAKEPYGGWTAYWWTKPGHPDDQVFRKIAFTIQVPGTEYQVAAGIYNDSITLEELNDKRK